MQRTRPLWQAPLRSTPTWQDPRSTQAAGTGPRTKHFDSHKTAGITRIEGGKSIPTVFKTGYEYARMGFTFAMEAAMPPLYARHVHEEIHDTPIIDEAALPVFGNKLVHP